MRSGNWGAGLCLGGSPCWASGVVAVEVLSPFMDESHKMTLTCNDSLRCIFTLCCFLYIILIN